MSQHLAAIAAANSRRLAAAAVCRDVRALAPPQAAARVARLLLDPDATAGSIRVERLLKSIPSVGPTTAGDMLDDAGIHACGLVREVTPLRRRHLARLVADFGKRSAAVTDRGAAA